MLALTLQVDFVFGFCPLDYGEIEMVTTHILAVFWVILLIGLGAIVMVFAHFRLEGTAPLSASLKAAPGSTLPRGSGTEKISQLPGKSLPATLRASDRTGSARGRRMTPPPTVSSELFHSVDIPIS